MISSKDNPKFKGWVKLRQKKFRKLEQLFLIEGEHLVVEALKANLVVDVLLREGIAFECDAPITYIDHHLFEKLVFTETSQGIMAVCRIEEQEIVNYERLLLIDNVQDPGNVGTLIRSALAFGYDGAVLSEETVDIYNDKVLRATQGAVFQLPIKVTNLESYISELCEMGVKVYGTHLSKDALTMEEIPASESMAFVVGNEGIGISDTVLERCIGNVVIRTSASVESLNVGVAGSILMQKFNGIK